jgi:hypothetical protein
MMNYIFREQAQWYGSELGLLLAVSQLASHYTRAQRRELMATRPHKSQDLARRVLFRVAGDCGKTSPARRSSARADHDGPSSPHPTRPGHFASFVMEK